MFQTKIYRQDTHCQKSCKTSVDCALSAEEHVKKYGLTNRIIACKNALVHAYLAAKSSVLAGKACKELEAMDKDQKESTRFVRSLVDEAINQKSRKRSTSSHRREKRGL